MKFGALLKTGVLLAFLPCLAWSANLTVTVTDANGTAISGADVVAISFSSMGPVGSLVQTGESGSATFTLPNYQWCQVVAVKSGFLPSARDQMFNWTSSVNVGADDITKTVQLRAKTDADKVKDIKVTVTHDGPAGGNDLLFLNLTNKGTFEQAGMGYFKMTGAGSSVCYIYSAPTSAETLPYQLDVFDPGSRRGNRIGVNNKPDTTVDADASSLDISSNGGGMAPPTRQMISDEKLGEVVVEGRAVIAGTDTGIEGVYVNIHDNTDHKLNLNTQTDENGYYAFYESADTANKVFTTGHNYSVNFMKHKYMGSWQEISYDGVHKSTATVGLIPVDGKIKGKVLVKVGDDIVPIPQAWANAWGDGRNYGTNDDWGDPGNDRKQGMSNSSGPVEKGVFELDGLSSGRYTLNIWSEFNNQPIIYNDGPDGTGAVDSNEWNTAGTTWGDDLIVEVDTGTNGGYAKVFEAKSPATAAANALDDDGYILITIEKTADGTNSISGQVTFTGTTEAIDPSSVLIVAREDWKTDGTMPKSGFTVLKAADKVSDYVYNYTIPGLGDATYRVEIKAPGFGVKYDNNGPRTNENITLSATGSTTASVNFKMAPAGFIEGVLRTPKGTIYAPKFDGPDNSNANVNANSNEMGCWGWSQVSKDGKFRLEGLLPGKYQLRTQGWGNSYTYATATLSNIIVEAGKTTSVEFPLRNGVRVHPELSEALPADMQADLAPGAMGEKARMSLVFTPANVALSAKNIDQVFHVGTGGDQENTLWYWGSRFQDISLEPGAYNFYLVYEQAFPMNATNYSKTIIGRAKNVVVDIAKQTDQYSQNGSTESWDTVYVQKIPIPLSIGANSFSGSYSGINTLREADMQVIGENFNTFMTYVPRVTLINGDGDILATGMCTPSGDRVREMDKGSESEIPGKVRDEINSMSFGIPYLVAQENVKAVVTTPNYPPLVRLVSIPGTMNVDMDADVGAGAKITGTIRNAAGSAVADAIVQIKGRLLDRAVKTGTDGTYLIPGLAPGVYRLLASGDGYALDADKAVVYNQDKIVNFTLTPCSGTITGTVYSQKFPYPLVVPGAKVVAYDDTANGLNPEKELAISEVITDNNGAYKISPVMEGHTYKVALVVPGKAVLVSSAAVAEAPGSIVSNVDFTYKSVRPKVKLIARPDANGSSVTLQGESPKKLVSLEAKYNEGATYSDTTAAALTVSQIGQKAYSITLPDKTKQYVVRFTVDDGASKEELDFVYDPKNKAQSIENIDQQAVASGDVLLDSQGNDTSGLYISPGSITLADGSIPEITINKENRDGSAYTSGMPVDEIGGDLYHITLNMDGSQQNADKSLTLTVGYDQQLAGNDSEYLRVCQYNETTGSWDPIIGAPMVDPISGTVSIEVNSITNAATNSAPRKLAQAAFDGKTYRLSPSRASTANQQGIFMVTKRAAGMAYTDATLEVFNVPNPFDLKEKSVTLNRGAGITQMTTKGTIIRFAVPSSFGTNVKTRFRIYNIAGELVRELNANDLLPGGVNGGYYYYLEWDGKNKDGANCASGVYLCAAEVGSEKKIIKMALIK